VRMGHSTAEGYINKENNLVVRYVFDRISCDKSRLYKVTFKSQDVFTPFGPWYIFYMIRDAEIWEQ